jgi:predicted ribosome quality control (RQC) complex YloA/Tae2 family protein
MDAKRELTSADVAAVVGELRAFEGAILDKAYLYGDDLVRLKLRDHDRGRVELFVEVGEQKRLHTVDPERMPAAPERPPGFAKMLRNRLSGATLSSVEQFGFDRVVTLEFERPDGDAALVVELFGEGNVAALNADREVIESLETVRLKSRTVAPGAVYEYPGARVDPFELDADAFAARMDDSDTDLVRTLATQLEFGGLYAEELCTRAGVRKTLPIAEAGEDEYRALHEAVTEMGRALRAGDLDPRIYAESGGEGDPDDDGRAGDGERAGQGRPVDVTPFPLDEREGEGLLAESFETFNAALDEYFYRLEASEDEEAGRDRPDFEGEIERCERIVEQQESAIEDFAEQAERERERAESLYGNYGLVDEVLSTVREAREAGHSWADIETRLAEGRERSIPAAEAVVDVDPAEGLVTVDLDGERIDLDPRDGVEKNADRLYREAKRVEEKREGAVEAVENTRAELEEWRRRREAFDADDDDEDDDEDEERTAADWLADPSIPVRQSEQWYERFRWFRTSDGFLVLGGRDADQNEELVKKYTERGDLFFHTQAHGAPVTVLKAADPSESARDVEIPERSREEAATFAVSYSSVWKEGKFAGDVYMASPDQVTKTPESGEYLSKGGFTVRGERTYYEDTAVDVAVGITCEPETRVIGGPSGPVAEQAVTTVDVEPGQFAQGDVAKRAYREFRERFADESFVRKVASPDRIAHFLPPGTSRIVE